MKNGTLPCPFCGNKDIRVYEVELFAYCFCMSCQAQGPTAEPKAISRSSAVGKWNTRHKESAKGE